MLETIQVNGKNISEMDFAQYVTRIAQVISEMKTDDEPVPSPFEVETVISFMYFKDCNCDIVVLEAGLGGKLDATNVIDTVLMEVFMPIALDHVDYLGSTVEDIALAKSGIIKRSTDVISSVQSAEVKAVLEKVAKKAQKANFITLNNIVNEVFPMISTSFSSKQILGFAANALNYNLVSTNGFPYQVTTSETVKNHSGVSFVIPIGLEQNVKQLHQELFNDDSYEASDKVKEIDSDIVYLTDITADNTEAMESTFKGDSLNEGTE